MAQLVLPLGTIPALGREDFIVGEGNRAAVAFIDAWPTWPVPVAALHGPAGSGKSHLAAIWAARSGAKIVEALKLDDADTPPLVVENVDEMTSGGAIFALIESGKPLLLTARTPPGEWPVALPDLASRFGAMLSFALWAPDDALLAGLARKLFADRQLQVPDAAIAQMVHALERSPAAIRDFVARADEAALSRKRAITPALIREILDRDQSS
jgi:chromosomal replication initiation ATPase DnaA